MPEVVTHEANHHNVDDDNEDEPYCHLDSVFDGSELKKGSAPIVQIIDIQEQDADTTAERILKVSDHFYWVSAALNASHNLHLYVLHLFLCLLTTPSIIFQ